MIPALTIAALYETAVWTGVARVATGLITADIASRVFKTGRQLFATPRDLRKWADLGKHAALTAFFGFCTAKNCPTVAVIGLLFYGIYSVTRGNLPEAYQTAHYIRKPVAYASTYLPASCRMSV